jgi:hypothetical protein
MGSPAEPRLTETCLLIGPPLKIVFIFKGGPIDLADHICWVVSKNYKTASKNHGAFFRLGYYVSAFENQT